VIDAYSWPTPNGHKVHIMLEEIGCPYRVLPINIRIGDQFTAAFRRLNPNGKIPAIVDPEGPDGQPITVFESGAILIYLAQKYGVLFSSHPRKQFELLQWLMFQMASVGPMLGQAMHFHNYAPEPIPYAIERYTTESARLYEVLNDRLKHNQYIAGDQYSIADVSVYPWVRFYKRFGVEPKNLNHFMRWLDLVGARPAVKRGLDVLKEHRLQPEQLEKNSKTLLFGEK
jgi:GST-like protein